MTERIDARGQMVRCTACGKRYRCTPNSDYFDSTTLEDGFCWDCFLRVKGSKPQPEPQVGEPLFRGPWNAP